MTSQLDKNKAIAITGATGYIAGWITKTLLEEGYTVHACVRNTEDEDKIKHLKEISNASSGNIIFYESDLLEEGSFDKAFEDCQVVFHTASPFFMKVKDPQKQLIEPALIGTRNVLNSVNKFNGIKKVVLTSSVNAIYGDNIDAKELKNNELDESIWNSSSSLDHNPYAYSKTLAEKEAWSIYKKQTQWDLIVINPSLVMGPATNPFANFESKNILLQMADGTYKTGAPHLEIGVVDVRNIAEAHIKAAELNLKSGRYIISGSNTSFLEMGKILKSKFPNYPFPTSTIPRWIIWLIAPLAGLTRKFVQSNVGHPIKMNNTKSIDDLSINYIPLDKTLNDFFEQLTNKKII